MPTVSVKLPEPTKQKLARLAASQGITPHALMVQAIEQTLALALEEQAFVAKALRARKQVLASGTAIDGQDLARHLKAKARGKPSHRPAPRPMATLLPNQA